MTRAEIGDVIVAYEDSRIMLHVAIDRIMVMHDAAKAEAVNEALNYYAREQAEHDQPPIGVKP